MPIAREVIYKCPKCGYKVIKFQGDVLYPGFDSCPKCGSKMEMKFGGKSIFSIIIDIFKRRKKWY